MIGAVPFAFVAGCSWWCYHNEAQHTSHANRDLMAKKYNFIASNNGLFLIYATPHDRHRNHDTYIVI